MSFRLDLQQPVPDAVRTLAQERLARVVGQLKGEGAADAGVAVHEARKDLKRLRSLVRMLRPGMTEKRYRRAADDLRAVSRSLGARREAVALVETVDALRDRFAGQEPQATFDGLRDVLVARAASAGVGGQDEAVDKAIVTLEDVGARVDLGHLDVRRRKALADGIARSYERGLDALRAVEAEPTDSERTGELLHDWRKRVKDLWYQQALVSEAWPALLGAQADEAKDLSQILGDDHDLWELELLLRDPDGPAAEVPADTDALLPLIAERRAELQAAACAAGARIYAEDPKAFRARIRAYLAAPSGA
jgi:CHAD domain-containing protein